MRGHAEAPSEVPPLDAQRKFWNRWNAEARSPDRLNDWARLRGDAILALLRSLQLDSPRILDLGCGSGWLTEQLSAFGPATGIDLSDECIAKARVRAPHIDYMAGNMFEAPLPLGHFDVVVSQDVVAHLVDQPGFVKLAARLLKPGGHLIITSTNRFVVRRMRLPSQPPEHIERWLGPGSLRRLLKTEFVVERLFTVMPIGNRGLLRFVNSKRLESLLTPLVSPERLKAAKERAGLGYNIIALARKGL
jgi:2-polyprenyl-3-methyl-5-hydroxy-6-metoxy-1,4-benzoquinol methylase